jgi:hypothetical protein
MDDHQFWHRWSGEATRALADDPGAGVLTLTSLGLIARARQSTFAKAGVTAAESAVISLWQRRNALTEPIAMPFDHHAVVISLVVGPGSRAEIDLIKDESKALKHPRPPKAIRFAKY